MKIHWLGWLLTVILPVMILSQERVAAQTSEMQRVPAGVYHSFFKSESIDLQKVDAFLMKETPVTNREFLAFVKANPDWQRSDVNPLFADKNYLRHWKSDLEIGAPELYDAPVVNVSWFAAKAYSEWKGSRLPTTAEWEYAAKGKPRGNLINNLTQYAMKWNSKPLPKQLPKVKSTYQNEYGLYDMIGLVWEWTFNFNNFIRPNDTRDESNDFQTFCGAAALQVTNPEDYPAFLRYGFRNNLKGNYCISSLGFRYVRDVK